MRLTPKSKDGPTMGVHAPTPAADSSFTLVVGGSATSAVNNSTSRVVGSPSRLEIKSKSTRAGTNAVTLVLLGMLVVLWGCSKAEEKPASSNNEPTRTAQTAAEKASAPNAPAAPSSPTAGAIASADGEKAGTRVDITELKRSSDNTVTLKFAIVNDSPERFSFNYDYGDSTYSTIDFNSIGGVTLVDGANKKKYFVVRDTENNCLCSRGLKDIAANSRGNVWAKFPPPPDDVQKISIVIPHFGPIDDVPISR